MESLGSMTNHKNNDRLTYEKDRPDVFDELVVSNCDLHIERMDDGNIWIGVYQGKDQVFHSMFTAVEKENLKLHINEKSVNDD